MVDDRSSHPEAFIRSGSSGLARSKSVIRGGQAQNGACRPHCRRPHWRSGPFRHWCSQVSLSDASARGLVPISGISTCTRSQRTRGLSVPRGPRTSSTSPWRDISFRILERSDLCRPASSASSVIELGLSLAISARRFRLCRERSFAKLPIERSQIVGSSLPFATSWPSGVRASGVA